MLLADVLRAVGDTIRWTYDLGDRMDHTITVSKIHAGGVLADSTGRRVVLLEGVGAGVPENPGSLMRHAERLDVLAKGGASARKAVEEMKASAVIFDQLAAPGGTSYDPAYLDLAARQRAIDAAMVEAGDGTFGFTPSVP